MIRRRILVTGRVQGVFYRDTCRRVAEQHAVAGSAVNLSDGRVEVVVEGDPEGVEALVTWCRRGPPTASVASVEVFEEEPEGLGGFRIV